MKTSSFICLCLTAALPLSSWGNHPPDPPFTPQDGKLHQSPLTRYEWHSLNRSAKQIERLMYQAQTIGTRIWPHAVRDASGRAGLIIMAQRPLLMSMNAEDLDDRQAWVILSVLAAARESAESPASLDHLALTDTEGAKGHLWYYDVDMNLARKLYRQLVAGTLTIDKAYHEIISSWTLVTATQNVASK